MRTLIVSTVVSVLFSGAVFAQAQGSGKKIQCWTDDKGHRSCGDYMPPQYANKEVKVINQQGMVVETKQRERTAEEVAADERKANEAKEAEKQARNRAAYDRFLLDTYTSVKDLEKARDIRVQTLDSRIALAEKAVADNQATLTDLRARAPAKPPENADPNRVAAIAKSNEKLKTQIATFEKSLADNTQAVATMKQERQQTVTKFGEDIQRWQQLKGPAPAATP